MVKVGSIFFENFSSTLTTTTSSSSKSIFKVYANYILKGYFNTFHKTSIIEVSSMIDPSKTFKTQINGKICMDATLDINNVDVFIAVSCETFHRPLLLGIWGSIGEENEGPPLQRAIHYEKERGVEVASLISLNKERSIKHVEKKQFLTIGFQDLQSRLNIRKVVYSYDPILHQVIDLQTFPIGTHTDIRKYRVLKMRSYVMLICTPRSDRSVIYVTDIDLLVLDDNVKMEENELIRLEG